MGKYITVSTKVRKELREEAKKLGINVSTVLRKALEEEVKRRRRQKLLERLEDFDDVLDRIDVEEFTKLVREDREKR
ncbi:MAG: type II toxin-antitoxin system CcdA family antitoxin [Candidatus Brockarchaeota archaeon]|nr:type II toxin-antitoxin system CcdA family antitoxin [Candidatus Brockarchaeota archaeon]